MKIVGIILLFVSVNCLGQTAFDVEGHRGARGLFPENSIPGFLEAVKLGVTTLEMDVVVSKDGLLVVSHDPYMNADICRDSARAMLGDVKEKYRIYDMPYEQICTFDCGSYGNARFPGQQKLATVKPLLEDVIDSVENYIAANKLPRVQYNIETKSTEGGDGKLHPAPAAFARTLYDFLRKRNVMKHCIIQSFDVRTLQEIRRMDTTVRMALLVFNTNGYEKNIELLGFTPYAYSPNYVLLNSKLVAKCKAANVKLIPWTINDSKKIKRAIRLGVDGIISDYPDRVLAALKNKK